MKHPGSNEAERQAAKAWYLRQPGQTISSSTGDRPSTNRNGPNSDPSRTVLSCYGSEQTRARDRQKRPTTGTHFSAITTSNRFITATTVQV